MRRWKLELASGSVVFVDGERPERVGLTTAYEDADGYVYRLAPGAFPREVHNLEFLRRRGADEAALAASGFDPSDI